ncbi:hypothetical protein NEOC65_001172 [Neochlamydia sp. AcF65]|nr:hypothetical protein [Neochlamydia sp. AcF65]
MKIINEVFIKRQGRKNAYIVPSYAEWCLKSYVPSLASLSLLPGKIIKFIDGT